MAVRRKAHEEHENLERWLLTYADMITLLTAFFLMLYSMSVMSQNKFNQLATSVRSGFGGLSQAGPSVLNGGANSGKKPVIKLDNSITTFESSIKGLENYIKKAKLSNKVSITETPKWIRISLLADNLLFDLGSAEIKQDTLPILKRIGSVLEQVRSHIRIEGNSCDLPIHTVQYPSNWELSSARACSVVRFLLHHSHLNPNQLSAVGYADTRPLVPNNSDANRARNRRVDIVILKPFTLKSDAQTTDNIPSKLTRPNIRPVF